MRKTANPPKGYALWRCPHIHCTLWILTLGGLATSHICPYLGGMTRISWMTYGPSLLEQLWLDADSAYRIAISDRLGNEPVKDYHKGYLNAMCKALALFMMPHFSTPKEIGAELKKRHESGDDYETPGLNERRYDPPPGDSKLATRAPSVGIRASDKPKPKTLLPPDVIEKIKKSTADASVWALSLGVTEADIQNIRQS
jgi:hypothetical protein